MDVFFSSQMVIGLIGLSLNSCFPFQKAKENEEEGLYREFDLCNHFSNVPSILSSRAGIWYLYCLDHYITSFGI